MAEEWIEKVREADDSAESCYEEMHSQWGWAKQTPEAEMLSDIANACRSIAAELRAARIAERYGQWRK